MVEKGIHNCFLPYEKVFSNVIISDILSGKRVFLANECFIRIQKLSFNPNKEKERCGFYLANSVIDGVPHFMLYNKKFNKKLKEKIDFRYVRISP